MIQAAARPTAAKFGGFWITALKATPIMTGTTAARAALPKAPTNSSTTNGARRQACARIQRSGVR